MQAQGKILNMDLFEAINHNQPILTVGQLSKELQKDIETKFANIKIRGEISGFILANSGHAYFNLKDNSAVIDAACWNFSARKFPVNIEDGLEVICSGRVTTYAPRSKYQVIVEDIEISGQGALMALLEKRKQKLIDEGLFDQVHKQIIPKFPETIAIITSETGAVIKDIIHRIEERFPLKIILWPVLVQGEYAASQVAQAIKGFNNKKWWNKKFAKPDLIIVARGGGSIEDLWAFNEEIIIREAFASELPIISAIGHETDYTLLDYVADLRAPTPTAAAELATPNKLDLIAKIKNLEMQIFSYTKKLIKEKEMCWELNKASLPNFYYKVENTAQKIDDLTYKLNANIKRLLELMDNKLSNYEKKLSSPEHLMANKQIILNKLQYALSSNFHNKINVENKISQLNYLHERLSKSFSIFLEKKLTNLKQLQDLLSSYSYQKTLERGFTIVKDSHGNILTSVKKTKNLDDVEIMWNDGQRKVKLIE